jgi:hypothetical protein
MSTNPGTQGSGTINESEFGPLRDLKQAAASSAANRLCIAQRNNRSARSFSEKMPQGALKKIFLHSSHNYACVFSPATYTKFFLGFFRFFLQFLTRPKIVSDAD